MVEAVQLNLHSFSWDAKLIQEAKCSGPLKETGFGAPSVTGRAPGQGQEDLLGVGERDALGGDSMEHQDRRPSHRNMSDAIVQTAKLQRQPFRQCRHPGSHIRLG